MTSPRVISTSKSSSHTFHKLPCTGIRLLEGLGVEGDAHLGATVKHRSRVAQDPTQPNLRQVHLIPVELFEELAQKGSHIAPGDMGENITTAGIDLLGLPKNTLLRIGNEAEIMVTGLRNPCLQLESLAEGLMKAVLDKDAHGNLIRKAGIMAVVTKSGEIRVGDEIKAQLPNPPFEKLDRV